MEEEKELDWSRELESHDFFFYREAIIAFPGCVNVTWAAFLSLEWDPHGQEDSSLYCLNSRASRRSRTFVSSPSYSEGNGTCPWLTRRVQSQAILYHSQLSTFPAFYGLC